MGAVKIILINDQNYKLFYDKSPTTEGKQQVHMYNI